MNNYPQAALTFLILPLALFAQVDSTSKVKVTTKLGKLDAKGCREVQVSLKIAKGWYVYANPVGDRLLEGAETVLTFPKDVKVLRIKYPKGEPRVVASINHRVYEKEVTLKALICPKRKTSPIPIQVHVQACDDVKGLCLLRGTVKVTAK